MVISIFRIQAKSQIKQPLIGWKIKQIRIIGDRPRFSENISINRGLSPFLRHTGPEWTARRQPHGMAWPGAGKDARAASFPQAPPVLNCYYPLVAMAIAPAPVRDVSTASHRLAVTPGSSQRLPDQHGQRRGRPADQAA